MTKIETRVFTYLTKFVKSNENNVNCIRCKVLKDPFNIFYSFKKDIVNEVVNNINDAFSEVNIGYKPWGFELIILPSEQISETVINTAGVFVEKEFGKAIAKRISENCDGDVIIRCARDSDQASLFIVEKV